MTVVLLMSDGAWLTIEKAKKLEVSGHLVHVWIHNQVEPVVADAPIKIDVFDA